MARGRIELPTPRFSVGPIPYPLETRMSKNLHQKGLSSQGSTRCLGVLSGFRTASWGTAGVRPRPQQPHRRMALEPILITQKL